MKSMSLVLFKLVVFEVAFERGDKSVHQHVFIEHVPRAQIFSVPVLILLTLIISFGKTSVSLKTAIHDSKPFSSSLFSFLTAIALA